MSDMIGGKIKVDFDREGWRGFFPGAISKNGNTFVNSVVDGRGRITGTVAGNGNERVAMLHQGTTSWGNTGIKSLWWGPSSDATNPRPQLGHIHNYNEINGVAYGVAIWHDTAFAAPGILNIARITFVIGPTGATTTTGSGTVTSGTVPTAFHVPRDGRVRKLVRNTNVAYAYLDPPHVAAGVKIGDTITIAGATDTVFNVAGAAVTVAGGGSGMVGYANVGSNGTENCGTGVTFTPTGQYRTNMPYWVRTEVSDDQVRIKQWAYGLPEPSWADTSAVARQTITTSATLTEDLRAKTSGKGASGIWVGHLHDNQYAEVSDVEIYPC